MKPNFKKVKKLHSNLLYDFLEQRKTYYMSGGFEGAQIIFRHEGDQSGITRKDGDFDETVYEEKQIELEMDSKLLEKGIIEEVFAKIEIMAKRMAEAHTAQAMKSMQNTAEKYQQTVQSKSSDIYEMMHEMIKKINIDFDDNGNPIMPTLYCGPEMYKQIENDYKSGKTKTTEEQKKYEELIEVKRREFNDRENSRKLVD